MKIIPFIFALMLSIALQKAAGQVPFASTVNYTVDTTAITLATADVNGDGSLDLICGDYDSNAITVLTNNGSGHFIFSGKYTVGRQPVCVITPDVNGDGKPDIVCSSEGTNRVTVLTNNSSGQFSLSSTLTVGAFPESVADSDFNGDGWIDLVCANYTAKTLSLFTNNGAGGFVLSATLNVPNSPITVKTADFNGDGWPDIICSDGIQTLFINNGHGGFNTSTINVSGRVSTADVNSDGAIDLICVGSQISVLTNNGTGTFLQSSSLPNTLGAVYAVAADVDGNGFPDLMWGNENGGNGTTIFIYTNNLNGGFGSNTALTVGSGPFQVIAADFNNDGRLDLASANAGTGTISVLINNSTYTPSGGLRVNILPSSAVNVGAQWQVDGGSWLNSGAFDYGLPAGNHTVTFSTLAGWTTPTSQTVNVNLNQTTNISALYVQQFGSLQISLSPTDAVSAGALWQIDGGSWQNSGTTLAGLPVGNHTVTFNTINSWVKPSNQSLAISNNQTTFSTGTYILQGSLQVTLSPAGAVSAGAQWQIDGGAWQNSGMTIAGLTAGDHTVSFSTVAGWATPTAQTVTISNGQTNTANGIYVQQFGSLQVGLSPSGAVSAGAQWQVDGVAWQNSGATVGGLTLGSHQINFSPVPGWGLPASQNVTVYYNQTTTAAGNYLPPHPATATAITNNGFVVAVTIVDGGVGYTNTPHVYLVGGGGAGAQGTAIVSNGFVIGVTITNAGFGYTNPPTVAIAPPFPLWLGIAPATSLAFTNLKVGTNYQLQISQSATWVNLGSSFAADATNYTQYFDGAIDGSIYRLMALPLPYGATATPILAYGFVVAATVNDGGSGYVSTPGVQIIGGDGIGAVAKATVSNGMVTAITLTNAGFGYTSLPTIQIDPPPIFALLPSVVKAFRLDYSGLTPALTYQPQASPDLSGWINYGTNFTATDYTNSQYFISGTNGQFFRLLLLP